MKKAVYKYWLYTQQRSRSRSGQIMPLNNDPRKGQIQVKLGQIRSNFKIQNYLTKVCLLCSFVSGLPQNVIFYVRQIEIPNIASQKCDVITLFCFFFRPLHSQKRDIALKFCLHVVCMYSVHFIPFFGYLEKLGFYRQLFFEKKLLIWRSKSKNIKNLKQPDCSTLNFTSFRAYVLCFTSNVHILEFYKHLQLFDPKSWNMTSLKRYFLKTFSTGFSEIQLVDVKLMPDKVLKVSRRCLLSCLSYPEKPGGGNIYPSLAQRGLRVLSQITRRLSTLHLT